MQNQAKLTLMDTSPRSQEDYQQQHPFQNLSLENAAPMMMGAVGEFFQKPNKTKQDTLDLLKTLRQVAALLSPADKQSLNTGSGPNGFMNSLDLPRMFPNDEAKIYMWAQALGALLGRQLAAPLKGSGKRRRKNLDGGGFFDFLFGNKAKVAPSPELLKSARETLSKRLATEAAKKAPARAAAAAAKAEKAQFSNAVQQIIQRERHLGPQEAHDAIQAGLARRDAELTNPAPVSMTNAPVHSLESQVPYTSDMRYLNPNFYERINGEVVFATKEDEIAAEREALARMAARPVRQLAPPPRPQPPAPQVTPLPQPNWRKWKSENRHRLEGIDREGISNLERQYLFSIENAINPDLIGTGEWWAEAGAKGYQQANAGMRNLTQAQISQRINAPGNVQRKQENIAARAQKAAIQAEKLKQRDDWRVYHQRRELYEDSLRRELRQVPVVVREGAKAIPIIPKKTTIREVNELDRERLEAMLEDTIQHEIARRTAIYEKRLDAMIPRIPEGHVQDYRGRAPSDFMQQPPTVPAELYVEEEEEDEEDGTGGRKPRRKAKGGMRKKDEGLMYGTQADRRFDEQYSQRNPIAFARENARARENPERRPAVAEAPPPAQGNCMGNTCSSGADVAQESIMQTILNILTKMVGGARGGRKKMLGMPLKSLISEHSELVKVLMRKKPEELAKMAKMQSGELAKYKKLAKGGAAVGCGCGTPACNKGGGAKLSKAYLNKLINKL